MTVLAAQTFGRRDDTPAAHPKQSLLFGELIYSLCKVYKVINLKAKRNEADGFERILRAPADSLYPAAEWFSWVITISSTQPSRATSAQS